MICWGKSIFLKCYLIVLASSLCLLAACGPHGGSAPKMVGPAGPSSLVTSSTDLAKSEKGLALGQVLIRPEIDQWNDLSFTFAAPKTIPQDGLIVLQRPLKKDHGRQKILHWVAAAIARSAPTIQNEDEWAEEEDLVSLGHFESRWAKEFNDAYQAAARALEGRKNFDFSVHTVFTFAPFKTVRVGLGPQGPAGAIAPAQLSLEEQGPNITSISDNSTSRGKQRIFSPSFNRLLEVKVNLVAYHPEKRTLRFLQALPKFAIHHGALQVQTTFSLDPAAMQAVLQNRELLGLQLVDYNLSDNISYRAWKTAQQQQMARVVISTPQGTRPYYVAPHTTWAKALKDYDPQMEVSQHQVLKFGGHLISSTNTSPDGLKDDLAANYAAQDYIFYTSHALNTELKAGESYYAAVFTPEEMQNANRAWSPWQEHEVYFPIGERAGTVREALRFDRPLEKGDLLEIELLRESEFIDDATRERYFKNRYTSGTGSTSNYINLLEALDAMALSWEIGDRRFSLADCHLAGGRVYYYDFWQTLSFAAEQEERPALAKLHHAQTFIDWEVGQNISLPINLFWHHSSLLEQSLTQWIKAVKIKVRGRVWRKN